MQDLNEGDIVRVYDANRILRGTGTVPLGETEVYFDLDTYAYYGFFFFTVQSSGKTESERTQKNIGE